jgi:predicted ester cyclase
MAVGPTKALREKRERIVIEHMESENEHDFETTLDTFGHPRYELIPTGEVHDGRQAVSDYFDETRAAFPDQRNELIALHHSDDAVIVEATIKGTHLGSFRGLPPTGRSFEMRIARSSSSRRTASSASASTSTRRRSSASSASPTTPSR